jgi:hypothetical protein
VIIGIDPSLTSTGVSDGVESIVLETSPKDEHSPPVDILRRVNLQIDHIRRFVYRSCNMIDLQRPTFYIEDVLKSMSMRVPVDANGRAHAQVGVGHLFEMGFWFARFYEEFDNAQIHLVSPSQLKGFVASKGNYPKAKMPLAVYKRWGVEFDGDPGLDKLHAFCLVKLGEAVRDGQFEYVEPHRRGKGTRTAKKRQS